MGSKIKVCHSSHTASHCMYRSGWGLGVGGGGGGGVVKRVSVGKKGKGLGVRVGARSRKCLWGRRVTDSVDSFRQIYIFQRSRINLLLPFMVAALHLDRRTQAHV